MSCPRSPPHQSRFPRVTVPLTVWSSCLATPTDPPIQGIPEQRTRFFRDRLPLPAFTRLVSSICLWRSFLSAVLLSYGECELE